MKSKYVISVVQLNLSKKMSLKLKESMDLWDF